MPTTERVRQVFERETNAALISIIAHALADLLVFDQSEAERRLTLQAAKALTELKRRNHAQRRIPHAAAPANGIAGDADTFGGTGTADGSIDMK